MKKRSIAALLTLILFFNTSNSFASDPEITPHEHEVHVASAFAMFQDQDFLIFLKQITPQALAAFGMAGVTSYIAHHFFLAAENNVSKKMFTYNLQEFKILQSEASIAAYLDDKIHNPFRHHAFSGIDAIIERTNATWLQGNDKVELSLGRTQTIVIDRKDFPKLIFELKDVPFSKIDQYFDQLYRYGFEYYVKTPLQAVAYNKALMFEGTLLHNAKQIKYVERRMRPARFKTGRIVFNVLLAVGAIYLTFFFYNNAQEDNQKPELELSSQELGNMILNDWESFRILILDNYPEVALTMHTMYGEFRAHRAWFLDQ